MRKFFSILFLMLSVAACSEKTNDLGALSPQKALSYMKNTKNLYIVDVAVAERYKEQHFIGAVNIPFNEMEKRYNEIPAGVPVLLHCRRGVVVPGAYETVKKYRTDIKELSYIAGVPPFKEYNGWKQSEN